MRLTVPVPADFINSNQEQPVNLKTCSANECARPAICRGWCTMHYQRWKRHGTPEPVKPSERERFWAFVDVKQPDDCWEWRGGCRDTGYGFFNIAPTTVGSHRYAYTDTYGPIPDGLYIDHICHNPKCCNPAHLQAVTPKQNNENHSGPSRRNTSGVRGVWWDASREKWYGQVGHAGRVYSAGRHQSLEAASEAVLALRNQLHTNNIRDRNPRL